MSSRARLRRAEEYRDHAFTELLVFFRGSIDDPAAVSPQARTRSDGV